MQVGVIIVSSILRLDLSLENDLINGIFRKRGPSADILKTESIKTTYF